MVASFIPIRFIIRDLLWLTAVVELGDDLVSDAANHFPDQNAVNQLTTVITTTLAGPTWNSSGGPATIQPFTNNGICVLVISQTQDVHEQIDQLLADLRTFKAQK
jgi:hypothetical protein